jgi:hypothetical protein
MGQINDSGSFAERHENSVHHHQHWSNTQNSTNQNHFRNGANPINNNQKDGSSIPPKYHIPPIYPQNNDQNQFSMIARTTM